MRQRRAAPVLAVQELHEPPALAQQDGQAARGRKVLAVLLQVRRQLQHACGQARDLDLGGAHVAAVPLELVDLGQVCAPASVPRPADPTKHRHL
jgi:hypothetical protein